MPGHVYATSFSAAVGAIPVIAFPARAANVSRRCCASGSTSPARERSGGSGNLDHVESEVEVFAEALLLDRALEIAIRRGDDAHVDCHLGARAERAHLPLLEHAEDLRLERHRHVADLVEEERPASRLDEEAGPRFARVGERATGVSEQLALEERLRHRRAVDRDEGAVGSAAAPMNRVREHLLARPALAGDEDRRFGVGHTLDEIVDRAHRFAAPDEAVELAPRLGRAQAPDLLSERSRPRRPVDCDREHFELNRLVDEVVRACSNGGDGRVEAPEPRHDDDRYVRPVRADPLAERDTVDARHVQIGHHDVEVLCEQPFERRVRARGPRDVVCPLPEPQLDRLAELCVVVHDEHSCHGSLLRPEGEC